MNKFISLAQLMDRRARSIQDPPTEAVLQKVRAEVAYYLNGGGERSLADINTTPQELHKTGQGEHLKRSKSHRLNGACRTP